MKELQDILDRPSAFISQRDGGGIAVSSRVRLARNLGHRKFPGWASEEDAIQVWEEVSGVLADLHSMGDSLSVLMSDLEPLDKLVLSERNLISREHAERGPGSGLIVAMDETVAIMVNEEDHFRLQALRPGLALQEAWEHIDAVDTEIEKSLKYAYDLKLGYLTSCPSNVGTGMRPSVMLHLPGLALLNEMKPIINGMGKIGLAVRGLGGEGSEAMGNMFQVSGQVTLGHAEPDMVKKLDKIVSRIVTFEKNARKRLVQNKPELVHDHVGRALGILSNAHILASKEALDLLSGLRLGVDLGLIRDIHTDTIDDLVLKTRPAHLQREVGRELKPRERDTERAAFVRRQISEHAAFSSRS